MATAGHQVERLWQSFRDAMPHTVDVNGDTLRVAIHHGPAPGRDPAITFLAVATLSEAPASPDVRVVDLKGKEYPFTRGREILHSASFNVSCTSGDVPAGTAGATRRHGRSTVVASLVAAVTPRLRRWLDTIEADEIAFGGRVTAPNPTPGSLDVGVHLYFYADV